MNERPIAAVRILLTLALVALVARVSLVPGQAMPGDNGFVWLVAKTPSAIQNLLHFVVYALLCIAWAWTFLSIGNRDARKGLAAALSIGIGGLLEYGQTFVPGRFGSISDVLINSLGALAGLIVITLLLRKTGLARRD